MGFMRDQAPRLIREKWADPNELAEEIYAIWTSDKGVTLDGPVTINNTTGGSSLTINQGSVGDTAIEINNNPADIDLGDVGDVVIEDNSTTIIDGGGGVEFFDDPPDEPEEPQEGEGESQGGGGGGTPGKVISGSGQTYQVTLYPSGPAGAAGQTVSVTQLDIASDAAIPEDTWTIVTQSGGSYYMQVPVWLEDLA